MSDMPTSSKSGSCSGFTSRRIDAATFSEVRLEDMVVDGLALPAKDLGSVRGGEPVERLFDAQPDGCPRLLTLPPVEHQLFPLERLQQGLGDLLDLRSLLESQLHLRFG